MQQGGEQSLTPKLLVKRNAPTPNLQTDALGNTKRTTRGGRGRRYVAPSPWQRRASAWRSPASPPSPSNFFPRAAPEGRKQQREGAGKDGQIRSEDGMGACTTYNRLASRWAGPIGLPRNRRSSEYKSSNSPSVKWCTW